MKSPRTLPAFSQLERERVHFLLAATVATMMGRKLEEGDWIAVYCEARGIPQSGWSNLHMDIVHDGLGVEQKMLCVRSRNRTRIADYCGRTFMHPAATRSIRIPDKSDPTEAARDILNQYAELIEHRREQVRSTSPDKEPDLRTGWLLWQESLREFMYFEEEMLPPDPVDFIAEWMDSGGGTRKKSRNLWVYEKETGRKRFSITTSAGAKIQPYFDIPPPTDENVYVFVVQGELLQDGLIRCWITLPTAMCLEQLFGDLSSEKISGAILECAGETATDEVFSKQAVRSAIPILVTREAYYSLLERFQGRSDEHLFQLLALLLRKRK